MSSIPAEISPTTIAERVVEAILAQKLAPGERLGEQQLAENFGVSRTMVREALMQLQARGFVAVQSRRGWFVVEPSVDEARDEVGDVLDLAGLIRQITTDTDLRNRLVANAYEDVHKRFAWDAVLKQYRRVLGIGWR